MCDSVRVDKLSVADQRPFGLTAWLALASEKLRHEGGLALRNR